MSSPDSLNGKQTRTASINRVIPRIFKHVGATLPNEAGIVLDRYQGSYQPGLISPHYLIIVNNWLFYRLGFIFKSTISSRNPVILMDIMSDLSVKAGMRIELSQAGCLNANCLTCNLRELCVPGGISRAELEQLDSIVATRRRIEKGATLFNSGDSFKAFFAVRTGFFKTCINTSDGRNQITGFQVPGELLGLDGFDAKHHNVDAVALEDSVVCVLPYLELERIANEFPPLQHQIHRVMSREIVRDQGVMLLLGSMKAEERVAAFLLNLSERFKRLGYSADEFILRMTRHEIGSYLGLKLETVSRAFSRLQEQGLVEAHGKSVKLLAPDSLRQIVHSGDH